MTKPDLIITSVTGYQWPHIRLFANSLDRSGFEGAKVVLANNMDTFTINCLLARDFEVVPFPLPPNPMFIIRDRFVPLLKFLEKYGDQYRYMVWADAGDQIFQRNPSEWFDECTTINEVIAATECWLIRDEVRYNDPWVKAALPDEYKWLRNFPVLCGGTIAGSIQMVYSLINRIYERVCAKPIYGSDQAFLNYEARQSGTYAWVPTMAYGWTATCSAFDTEGFHSPIGIPNDKLTDYPPVFDQNRGLVLTPDGKTPFALVHQYNRDSDWIQIMHQKYGDLA